MPAHFWGSGPANYHLVAPINGAVVTSGHTHVAKRRCRDSGYAAERRVTAVCSPSGTPTSLGSAASLNLKKPIVGIDSTPDYGKVLAGG